MQDYVTNKILCWHFILQTSFFLGILLKMGIPFSGLRLPAAKLLVGEKCPNSVWFPGQVFFATLAIAKKKEYWM